jgi:hypothetical protein
LTLPSGLVHELADLSDLESVLDLGESELPRIIVFILTADRGTILTCTDWMMNLGSPFKKKHVSGINRRSVLRA